METGVGRGGGLFGCDITELIVFDSCRQIDEPWQLSTQLLQAARLQEWEDKSKAVFSRKPLLEFNSVSVVLKLLSGSNSDSPALRSSRSIC